MRLISIMGYDHCGSDLLLAVRDIHSVRLEASAEHDYIGGGGHVAFGAPQG